MYGHAAAFLVMTVCAVSSRTVWSNVAKGETQVTEFTGQTSVMYHHSAIVNMTWKIHPANATLFGIKVFHGNSTTTNNQVFGYNFIDPDKTWASPKFQGRLHHNVYHQDDATVFQLTITDPKYSDIGVYVAVLYGSGFDDQLEATLNLTYENVTQFLVSNQTSEKSKEEAGSKIKGLFIFLAIAVPIGLVGLFVIPIAVKKWKKQKRARIHKKKGEDFEETISLQKPGEDKERFAVFFEWKQYLCSTRGPTDVKKSDDTGNKEEAV